VNIGGALGIVGQKTLNHYQWGQTVVNIVNSHLIGEQHITVQNTGMEVTGIILTLEDELKTSILSIDVGPLHGSISIVEHEQSNTSLAIVLLSLGLVLASFFITYVIMEITSLPTDQVDDYTLKQFFKSVGGIVKDIFNIMFK